MALSSAARGAVWCAALGLLTAHYGCSADAPERKPSSVRVASDRSAIALTFALGNTDTRVEYRERAGGVEDWVQVRSRSVAPQGLVYRVDLERTAGLRQVAGIVELLDESGTPRLRVGPAYLVDAAGTRRDARITVSDCAVDTSPAAPWGRPVTPPGADSCTLSVDWDDHDLRYPIEVDPPWTSTSALAVSRTAHTATRLANGRVLVTGSNPASASAEIFDPVTKTWAATGNMTAARSAAAAVLLGSGKVLVTGGRNGGTPLGSAELYDPAAGSFAATGPMKVARAEHTATALANGKVLVTGGFSTSGSETTACDIYDAGIFTATNPMASARAQHTATLLNDGRVLVIGTWGVATPEAYTPSSGTWNGVPGAGLFLGLENHTATLLSDGRVLVVGGRTGGGLSNTEQVALFNPSTNGWTAATDLPGPIAKRYDHAAALLSDGRVAVIGGECSDQCAPGTNAHDFDDAVFWSANTGGGTWANASGKMSQARKGHTATALQNGNVLVVGGTTSEVLCLAQGCACNTANECYTGFCVDGVCCDTACPGTCMACSNALKGVGPDGTCSAIATGTDPQSECTATPEKDCGLDGMCDGAGACRKHPSGTVCVPSSCIDANSEVHPDTCDGNGNCVDKGSGPCDPSYVCKDGGCKKSCNDKSDCPPGYECIGGACSLRPDGTPCTAASQCQNNHCVDGVCCAAACDGQCEACNEAGSEGKCIPVSGEPRPGRQACATGEGPCGSTCNGAEPTKCVFPGQETSCGFGKACDGKGACAQGGALCSKDRSESTGADGKVSKCAPYLCDTSSGKCGASCTATSDCATSYYCDQKKCVKGGSSGGDDGGCNMSNHNRGHMGLAWLVALGVLGLARRRGRIIAAAAFVLGGCSQAPSSSESRASLGASPLAKQRIETLRATHGAIALPRGIANGFAERDGRVIPQIPENVRRGATRPARIELPGRSHGAFSFSDESSGLAVSVALDQARDSALEVADGLAVYRGAAPDGGDVVLRAESQALEDYVSIPVASAEPVLRYRIGLAGIAGLRLIENTLELLDPNGVPRIRVEPPFVTDAHGDRHPATLSVDGCAVDKSPIVPFDRPVTAPGATACTVVIAWNGALDYPVLVDPAWTTTGGVGVGAKPDLAAAVLADGRMFVCGGGSTAAWIYNGSVFSVAQNMTTSRSSATATLLANGSVLVAGGGVASAERYDPTSGVWSSAGTMSAARTDHHAVRLSDGSVLVTGGDGVGTAQRYVPSSNSWLGAGSIGNARTGHTATLLADGRVLVAGGKNGTAFLNTTTIYTLGTGWAAADTMNAQRQNHAAALLSDNRVLAAGGEDTTGPGAIASTELYNPTNNTWTNGTAMPSPTRAAIAVPFGGHTKVYVIGGRTAGAGATTNTWIYDVAGGGWTNGAQLNRSRFLHTAELIGTGQILVAGGTDSSAGETFPPSDIQCVDYGCSCSASVACLVGTCVDGVCCKTACNGACEACSAAKKSSGANGDCGPIADGSDPDDECATDPASTCGKIGSCNGAGACRLYAAGTECAAASCPQPGVSLPASTCDGMGTCVAPQSLACAPFGCNAGVCNTSCTTEADCVAGFSCKGSVCAKKGNGDACTAPGDCSSGFCADGVCCDTACTGQCEACAEAATPGLCIPIKNAPKGNRPACSGTGTCVGACNGINAGECTYPTTACGDGKVCSNGECVQTGATCVDGNAASLAPTGAKTQCKPYLCDSATGTCRKSCTKADQCALGYVCDNGQCVNLGTGGGGDGGPKAAGSSGDDGGCGCRVSDSNHDRGAWLAAIFALMALFSRRRNGAPGD